MIYVWWYTLRNLETFQMCCLFNRQRLGDLDIDILLGVQVSELER